MLNQKNLTGFKTLVIVSKVTFTMWLSSPWRFFPDIVVCVRLFTNVSRKNIDITRPIIGIVGHGLFEKFSIRHVPIFIYFCVNILNICSLINSFNTFCQEKLLGTDVEKYLLCSFVTSVVKLMDPLHFLCENRLFGDYAFAELAASGCTRGVESDGQTWIKTANHFS